MSKENKEIEAKIIEFVCVSCIVPKRPKFCLCVAGEMENTRNKTFEREKD